MPDHRDRTGVCAPSHAAPDALSNRRDARCRIVSRFRRQHSCNLAGQLTLYRHAMFCMRAPWHFAGARVPPHDRLVCTRARRCSSRHR